MAIAASPELEAVVRRLWKGLIGGSEGVLANILSPEPDLRVILSGDDEWFAGSEIAPLLSARSDVLDIERVEFERLEAHEAGDFGWAACAATMTLTSGETTSVRQTTVFMVDEGVWRCVQMHMSIGVPTAETFGVQLAEGLSDLVASLSAGNNDQIAAAAGVGGVVTLLFTDIEGSTRLSEARGDAQWSQDILAHLGAVGAVVEGCGGTVVKTLGDGSMAAFPSAADAADAAIGIERLDGDDAMRVRIGVHSGEAVSVGDDYVGIAVAKAARVTSAAAGGEILISAATKELLGRGRYLLGDERVVELKGLGGTHRLFPLMWQEP